MDEAAATKPKKRRRPTKLIKTVRERFLTQLALNAHVGMAAAAAGIGTETVYALRRRDPGFAHEWRMALLTGYDRIEAALIRRALGLGDHAPVVDVATGVPLEEGEVDVSLATQLLDRHRHSVERATREVKQPAFRASRDAAEETLLKKIRAYARSASIAPPFAKPRIVTDTAVAAIPDLSGGVSGGIEADGSTDADAIASRSHEC